VAFYRFYLETDGGRIVRATDLACADDGAAWAAAERLLLAADAYVLTVEVWERARYVCRLERAGLPHLP
jgi:hypothetical protein